MIYYYINPQKQKHLSIQYSNPYLTTLQTHQTERHFPYRYLHDENDKILPIVVVAAFFRDDKERVEMYNEYMKNNVKLVGATMYKSFPKPITDGTGDADTINDKFDYCKNIKNWICCFKNVEKYGFDHTHNLIDISESDFYDAEIQDKTQQEKDNKKYDIIYSCLNDDEKSCPLDGWNAVNRNFDLAKKCFPIMINEFKMKILVLGRTTCGLKEQYGDSIDVMDMLPFHEFQQKLKESKILFIPNRYDASPRVVSEAIIKDVPVLMNENILCGSKYINRETGEFFHDEHDIRQSLTHLLERIDTISPKKWWSENYSKKKSAKKFRDFLYKQYPDELENVEEVHFYM